MSRYQLEHSSEVLVNVHTGDGCLDRPCPIHNKTNHSMRHFPQHWRGDRGIMERLCPHGIGHPDPDDLRADGIHGCDGCCYDPNKEESHA